MLNWLAVLIVVLSFANLEVMGTRPDNMPPQTESYAVANPNPEVLYDWFVSSGGSAIGTKDRYWGHCKVWVETVASKAHFDIFARNNPDGTFYPGDAFGYLFSYGWTGDPQECRNFTVCPVYSMGISGGASQPCNTQSLNPVPEPTDTEKGSVVFGTAEILVSKFSGHFIQLQVGAERWGCYYPKKAIPACGWASISATGSFSPLVIDAKTALDLSYEHLRDLDGYKSGNLDGTYYLHDAITVIHNPTYQWKKERIGTMSVKVAKSFDLISESEFQCESSLCNHTLVREGFEPHTKTYEYGSGITLYNATKNEDIQRHTLAYQVEMYNLGRLIYTAQEKIAPLVVSYEPRYVSYPYLILKDNWWSWSNSHGVALEYLGSLGGGPDDTLLIHQNRRSKINSFEYFGYAFDPILKRKLNETLSWGVAGPPHIEKKCYNSDIDAVFESKDKTAMFVRSGFGKVEFFWPVTKTMLEKRYLNGTIQNTLQSASFAGLKSKDLVRYTYQYPDVKFANPVKILTYHSDGFRTALPVSVRLVPDISKGAKYTQDYVCEKVFHDTGSPVFADMVSGDMYGMENAASGIGYVNMKTHLTSTWFAPFYHLLVNDTLDLPISEGYKALSPYQITITVGNKTRVLDRIVNFLSPFVHVVNMDLDNALNVTESFGFVRINPDERFGEITRVLINGKEVLVDCSNGCTTASEKNIDIEAWNLWGGRAVYHMEKSENTFAEKTNWDLAFVGIFAMVFGLFLWKFAAQALQYLGFRRAR